jgi:dTDP-4-dehydrorhamnose reductase
LLAAALARQHDCDADPDLARCLNEELPGEVAASCARRGARLVHISTDLVFSSRAPRGGFNEGAVPDATSVYGRSKARGEVRVLVAYPKALVVRLPLLYGDSLGRGLGASDGLLAALKRGERPLLFEDEWRTPLDVTAAAAALVHLAQLEVAGLLHLAGPQRLSRLELGRTVLAARALAPHKVRAALRREVPGCVERPEDVSLCAARALALLPAPMPSPEEALGAG